MMKCIREHIHEMFELHVKMLWLKEINIQLERVNRTARKIKRMKSKHERQNFVLKRLIEEYNKLYHDGLCTKEDEHG